MTVPACPAEPLVVWVFRNGDGDWSLRREGDRKERLFCCRRDALAFAHCLADAAQGSKLFIQLSNGRFVTECLRWAA